MKDRKKKHRILKAAGIVHCSGWIREADQRMHEILVADAADDVKAALSKGDE